MTDQQTNNQRLKENNGDEIDLVALIKTIWEGRIKIIKTVIIFILIGLFIAIFSPQKYKVSSVMVPQTGGDGTGKLGGLSSLAAMAGFNLNMGMGTELSPVLYPQIVQSIPFKRDLMEQKLSFEGVDQPITLYEFYTEHERFNLLAELKKYSIGLPREIIKLIRKNNKTYVGVNSSLAKLSTEEKEICDILEKTVYIDVDDRDGYIVLTAEMPEALAAAQLGLRAQELLEEYITDFKIEKATSQLEFIEDRFIEKRNEFLLAQKTLANFRDKNKNVSTALAKTEEERLQSEYQIAQAVYTELAKQLENAKIQVKEDAPVLSVIQPIVIPYENYKPKRMFTVVIWTFLGVLAGIGLLFGEKHFTNFKSQWRNEA